VLLPHQSIHLNGLYQDRRKKARHEKKQNFVQHALRNRFVKGNQKEGKKMTLLTELKDKTASLARLLTAAMTSMLLLGILAPSGSGGTTDGVLNFSNTPLLGPQPTITTFDAPGAGTGPGQGTIAFAINPAGTISGRYADAGGAIHAIVRTSDGAIISFDAPGAGTGPFQGTLPLGINQAGTIEGEYVDAGDASHGFLRTSDGTITTFDVPGAGTGPFQGTAAQGINAPGTVTGEYVDGSDVNHGFVRTTDGVIITFDVPGAGTGPGQGTIPLSNNPADAIIGYYIDASDVSHGFLRTAHCGTASPTIH
jgi:hypothetical protein